MSKLTKDRLLENFDGRAERLGSEYMREVFNWTGASIQKKQTLPYDSSNLSLAKVRAVGRLIAQKPTGISAMSKLMSFTVGPGHEYTFCARRPATGNARRLREQDNAIQRMNLVVELESERLNWVQQQEETYWRLLRDGEVFRRLWTNSRNFDLTYIDPEEIAQPSSIQEINPEGVPDEVLAMFDGIRPPGVHGVIHEDDDVRAVLGYWLRNESLYDYLPAQGVQHIKDGVDSNDPRGVPRFYWALCHVLGIDEIDGSMKDLFVVQARHAAVYNFEQTTLLSDLQSIAFGEEKKAESRDEQKPGVTVAKGFEVELPGMNVAAKDAVEIIQQEQRFVGGVSDIPEHLISEDAASGNRSSLVAAEGPFDRRIKRDQNHLWTMDRHVIWTLVAKYERWSQRRLRERMEEYKLNHTAPSAVSRDRLNEIKGDEILATMTAMSVPQIQRKYKLDCELQTSENRRVPLPQPGNNTNSTNTGGRSPTS